MKNNPIHNFPRPGMHGWILFTCCLLANVFAGQIATLMSVYLPNVLDAMLGNEPGPDRMERVGSYINAIFLLGWTLGGFSWGLIADGIGRSMSFILSLACLGIFTLAVYFAPTWETLVFLRLLAGFGVGGVMVISVTFLSEVWPGASRNIVIGIVSIGFPIGIFTSGIVNLLSGWRAGFLIGALPLLLAIIAIFTIKESVAWSALRPSRTLNRWEHFRIHRAELIHGTIVFGSMLIGLWAVFSWYPTWVQSLLQDSASSGQQERGIVMMVLGLGGLIGGFLSGWVAKGIGVRNSMVLCFSGCSLMAFLLFGFHTTFSVFIYVETVFLSLFFGLSQGLLSFYIPQLFPTEIRAGATGFCFNLGRIFTTLAVFSLGNLVSLLGGYGNALLLFSGIFLIGLILILLGRPYPAKLAPS